MASCWRIAREEKARRVLVFPEPQKASLIINGLDTTGLPEQKVWMVSKLLVQPWGFR